jgi:hypothetical protein
VKDAEQEGSILAGEPGQPREPFLAPYVAFLAPKRLGLADGAPRIVDRDTDPDGWIAVVSRRRGWASSLGRRPSVEVAIP